MDWIAAFLELLGGWLIGNKRRVGFISNIIGCLIWVYVVYITRLYGLLLVVVPAIGVNARNWLKWRREEKEDE